jgi:hypothetical protein
MRLLRFNDLLEALVEDNTWAKTDDRERAPLGPEFDRKLTVPERDADALIGHLGMASVPGAGRMWRGFVAGDAVYLLQTDAAYAVFAWRHSTKAVDDVLDGIRTKRRNDSR